MVMGRWYYLSVVASSLSTTFLVRNYLVRDDRLNVIPMLWKLFLVGMGGILAVLLMVLLSRYSNTAILYNYLTKIYFTVCAYALMIFFLSAFFIFRRFALYQKTVRKLRLWYALQGMLVLALAITGFPEINSNVLSNLLISFFFLASLVISTQASWAVYLTFSQKLKVLGLFLLIIIVCVTYIISFSTLMNVFGVVDDMLPDLIFFKCIISFGITYSSFSILILFFNLPTASIFERQSSEVASFNKINQSIQANLDSADILATLLDASVLSSDATAGWLTTVVEESSEYTTKLRKRIVPEEVEQLIAATDCLATVQQSKTYLLIKNLRKLKNPYSDVRFRSLLAVPIATQTTFYGVVVVVSELTNAFEDVAIESLCAFAEQAGIALDNASLVKNAIQFERYREQLKIAREVQRQLLPRKLPSTAAVQFAAVSETAEEVGGDYFDVVHPHEHCYRIAIGDVSGKGTTAAFYMAEMKGVFHALTQAEITPAEFITRANTAISDCLQRGSFMTLTYLQINTASRTFDIIRAGHCPTYYYHAPTDSLQELRDGTLGLGIVRSNLYAQHIPQTAPVTYNCGDCLVLFTDGILEARNLTGEEFGYHRLKDVIHEYRKSAPETLAKAILASVKTFANAPLDDDHTVLVVRFA